MDTWKQILILMAVAAFILVLFIWLLKEWKRFFIFGGLSKRNSKLLRAAARHASRTRHNGEERARQNAQNQTEHIIIALPPPNFEAALNLPSPIYFIEVEEQPPNYVTALSMQSTITDTDKSITVNCNH